MISYIALYGYDSRHATPLILDQYWYHEFDIYSYNIYSRECLERPPIKKYGLSRQVVFGNMFNCIVIWDLLSGNCGPSRQVIPRTDFIVYV